jgi:hypothetical protein
VIITGNTVWRANRTITLDSDVEITHVANLTTKEGVIVNGGSILVAGEFDVKGTKADHVSFDLAKMPQYLA